MLINDFSDLPSLKVGRKTFFPEDPAIYWGANTKMDKQNLLIFLNYYGYTIAFVHQSHSCAIVLKKFPWVFGFSFLKVPITFNNDTSIRLNYAVRGN